MDGRHFLLLLFCLFYVYLICFVCVFSRSDNMDLSP